MCFRRIQSVKNATEIGQLIRERRVWAGMTKTELAALCKCTAETITNIENGVTGAPVMVDAIQVLEIKLGEL
jgi:DNA-binding XRE family transcriptional regulator